MAGGQAYYGHKYKSRYVDIQRLRQAAEARLGQGLASSIDHDLVRPEPSLS